MVRIYYLIIINLLKLLMNCIKTCRYLSKRGWLEKMSHVYETAGECQMWQGEIFVWHWIFATEQTSFMNMRKQFDHFTKMFLNVIIQPYPVLILIFGSVACVLSLLQLWIPFKVDLPLFDIGLAIAYKIDTVTPKTDSSCPFCLMLFHSLQWAYYIGFKDHKSA